MHQLVRQGGAPAPLIGPLVGAVSLPRGGAAIRRRASGKLESGPVEDPLERRADTGSGSSACPAPRLPRGPLRCGSAGSAPLAKRKRKGRCKGSVSELVVVKDAAGAPSDVITGPVATRPDYGC